jgi:hypothetical protein
MRDSSCGRRWDMHRLPASLPGRPPDGGLSVAPAGGSRSPSLTPPPATSQGASGTQQPSWNAPEGPTSSRPAGPPHLDISPKGGLCDAICAPEPEARWPVAGGEGSVATENHRTSQRDVNKQVGVPAGTPEVSPPCHRPTPRCIITSSGAPKTGKNGSRHRCAAASTNTLAAACAPKAVFAMPWVAWEITSMSSSG